jgi:hypothetical protein
MPIDTGIARSDTVANADDVIATRQNEKQTHGSQRSQQPTHGDIPFLIEVKWKVSGNLEAVSEDPGAWCYLRPGKTETLIEITRLA